MHEQLMEMAEKKLERIKELFEKSDLPDDPDVEYAERTLIQIRAARYQKRH